MSQLLLIMANMYENATKISMLRTSDLLFTLLFQYFFLGIVSNVLSVTGSVCITVGILLISGVSLLEQRFNKASLLSRICFLNFDQSKYRTNRKLGYYFLSYLTFVIRSKKSIRFIKFFFVNKKNLIY